MDSLFPINFSYSMLSDLWQCEMFWYRKHCQRLTGMYRSGDLIAGGLFASACEVTRKAYFNDGIDEETAIEMGYEHILCGEDTTDDLKTNERMAYTFKKYFKKFRLESTLTPCKLVDGSHAVEYSFVFDTGIAHPEIEGQNIYFKGKLDGLYERLHQGKGIKRYVLDEKTTKSVRRITGTKLIDMVAEEDEYRTSGQFIGYHWAARQLGVKTESTLIRRVPIGVNFEEAYEIEIPITDFMIENWVKTTFTKIEELVEKYKWIKATDKAIPQDAFYPVYNSNCNSYRKLCVFADGCIEKYGEQILASRYQQVVFHEGKEHTLKEFKQLKGLI